MPKTILAIDCSFGGHSVAIARGKQILAACSHPKVVASIGLIASIEKLRRKLNLELADLDYLAFGAGPGLFSGIRAACTAVQGLGYVFAKPIVEVPTTLALASTYSAPNMLIAFRAYQGHCYLSAYQKTKHHYKTVLPPTLYPNDNLPKLTGSWHLGGRRLAELHQYFSNSTIQFHKLPNQRGSLAPALTQLGLHLASKGQAVAAVDARPNYVRTKVAYTKAERLARQTA